MSNDINLNEVIGQIVPETQVIGEIVQQAEINVNVIGSGPKGDKGDKPIRGVDYFTQEDIDSFIASVIQDKTYVHDQIQSSNTWSITHNLGKYPAVSVVNSGGTVSIGEVTYINLNQVTITFSAMFSGRAYLN